MPGPVTVVAAIIRHEGRILLTRRPPEVHLGGQWEFPGGKVHPGEPLETALTREIAEELGIEIAIDRLYLDVTHSYPERTVHLYFFECRLKAGAPEARHADALAWVRPEDLAAFEFPEANRTLIRNLTGE